MATEFGGRGGYSGRGRGNFSQESDSGQNPRGAYAGIRGRGNFNQESENGQNSRGAFFGRGNLNQESAGGQNPRGAFTGGRGNFNQESYGGQNSRGAFAGGRGGNNFNDESAGQNPRGAFTGGRGNLNQDTDSGQNSRGAFSGRGNSNQESVGGQNPRGAFAGGRGGGNFNDESAGQNSRGAFANGRGSNQNSESGENSRGAFSGRGNYNQDSESGQNSRGAYGGRGRGNYNQESQDGQNSRGAFSGRGNSNQESVGAQNPRGAFAGGRGGGNFNDESAGQNPRGAFASRRGNFNQNSESGQNSRGTFAGGRGNYNQDSDGGQNSRGTFSGRADYNQDFDAGQNSRGGSGRGRGGNFNQERNFGEQENQEGFGNRRGGGYTQSRTGADAPAGDFGGGEEDAQPQRAPINFVPIARGLEQLYKEDEESAAAYAECVDLDDDIIVKNAKFDVARIQNWDEADLDPVLLENVKVRSKYSRPRKIQGATIPLILDHFDIKAQAETGSGKTAAFVLPILDACIKAKKSQGDDRFESELATPYAVIIGPTRELVMQVYEQAQKFANGTGVTVAKAYGQYNINRNHEEIRQGADLLIATVGRLKHFVLNEDIFVHKLKYLVLDEADRLLDQSFAADIEAITSFPRFPPKDKRITMLFSATFDDSVMEVADRMLRSNAIFITNQRNDPNKKIKQDFIKLDAQKSRLDVLTELLKEELDKVGTADKMRRTLVFVNTKRMSDMAALYLCQHGVPATSINGDRAQNQREEALSDFRNHVVSVLISTDVTARGIDVKHLDHVINFDLPQDSITYVHRIGRTGRITQGFATTLADGSEPILQDIANMLRKMGTLPESLEKILGGASAPSNFAAAAPPPQNSNGQAQPAAAANAADDDW